MKKQMSDKCLLLGAFLLSAMNLFVMHFTILFAGLMEWDVELSSFADNLVGVAFDILFLFGLINLFLLGKRQKLAMCFLFFTTWAWSFANIMYFRFFQHYVSLSAITQYRSLSDPLILQCVFNEIHFGDLYFAAVVLLFVYIQKRLTIITLPVRQTFLVLCFFLCFDLFTHGIASAFSHVDRKVDYFRFRLYMRHINQPWQFISPNYACFHRGCVRTLIYELKAEIQGPRKLSVKEREIIRNCIKDSKPFMQHKNVKISNVIFIIVESYMSFVTDMSIHSQEVTPFLNALKNDSNVYYNGNMTENVTIGESSDGQFIYMTGLLPLRSFVTVSKARETSLPGLPQKLEGHSRMVIPTLSTMWNQEEMCRQYAFENLYSSIDFNGEHGSNLNDEQVFTLAENVDRSTKKPFFSVVLTMSMHQPYIKQIDSTFPITDASIDKELACYLNVCHYTDHQIGRYFEHLKKSGLYANSLIVITADHPVHNTDFGGVSKDIPLYLVNVPNNIKEKMWQGACNQIDVYTTLLDLLGIESDWYGLGQSLLSPDYSNIIDSKKWDVSEWIIRGDYFAK